MPKRDYLYSSNGIRILCDTRYVPFPIGRNNYETAVFKADKHGKIKKPGEHEYMYRDNDEYAVNLGKPECFPYPYYCVKEGDNACCGITMEDIKNGAKKFFDRIGVEISFPG